jgi:hypothetical protein
MKSKSPSVCLSLGPLLFGLAFADGCRPSRTVRLAEGGPPGDPDVSGQTLDGGQGGAVDGSSVDRGGGAQWDGAAGGVDGGGAVDASIEPACGDPGTVCCAGSGCSGGGCCVSGICVAPGATCPGAGGGGVCASGVCGSCGGAGLRCCGADPGVCTAPGTLCSAGICVPCGFPGVACCAGDSCLSSCCCADLCVTEGSPCGTTGGACVAGLCSGCADAGCASGSQDAGSELDVPLGGQTGSGGVLGTGGTTGTGGAGMCGDAWSVADDGFVTMPAVGGECWHGYAYTGADNLSSAAPASFDACGGGCVLSVAGMVEEGSTAYAYLGLRLNESVDRVTKGSVTPQGSKLVLNLTLTGPEMYVFLESETTRWCAPLNAGEVTIPYAEFNTSCWDNSGSTYAKQPIKSVLLEVPGNVGAQSYSITLQSMQEL